jgi:hypothetical protein
MDQVDQMLGLNVHRNMGIADGVSGARISHDMGNGYSAETTTFGLGHSFYSTDNGMLVGAGLNRATTTITGADSNGELSTTVIQGRVGKALDDRDMTIVVGGKHATSDLSYTRTIGDFSAAGETSSRDMSATVIAEKSTGSARPFAGLTVGKISTDAWDETGDVQAALSHAASDETYRYATLGFNVDTGLITASISKDFGDSEAMHFGAGIDRTINERVSIGVNATRTMDGDNTSTYVSAGLSIKF